ncbi:MAG: hypothetical protein MOGDAGHF_00840 [Rhodocyclaceae bacterium]|nr:hypothetical protein [Rhodocyclaceae bacterium]
MTAVRRLAVKPQVKCHEFSLDSHSKVSSPCPDSVKLGEIQQPVRKMPGNTQVGLNAALALLKLIDNRGWNEKLAGQARSLIDLARRDDPANPRAAVLTKYFQGMLTKYGIQPTRP